VLTTTPYTVPNMEDIERHFRQYPNYRLQKGLIVYASPFVLVGGVVGNVLSVLVLSRPSMRRVSTYTYLMILSLADTFVLLAGLHWLWLKELTNFSLREYSSWSCRAVVAINSTASDYSVWLIVAVTVERYIAVCHPLRAQTMCTRRRALVISSALFLLLLAVNAHFLWTMDIEVLEYDNNVTSSRCNYAVEYIFLEDAWPSVDAILYSFLPLIAIVIFNALIVQKVIRARGLRNRMSEQPASLNSSLRSQNGQNFRLTVMLFAISVTFIIFTLPMNSILIYNHFVRISGEHFDDSTLVNMALADVIARLLMYVNHSSNFFLYCATGQKFRRQLCASFGCFKGSGRHFLTSNNDDRCEMLRLSQRRALVPVIADDCDGNSRNDATQIQEVDFLKRSISLRCDQTESKLHRFRCVTKASSFGLQVTCH